MATRRHAANERGAQQRVVSEASDQMKERAALATQLDSLRWSFRRRRRLSCVSVCLCWLTWKSHTQSKFSQTPASIRAHH